MWGRGRSVGRVSIAGLLCVGFICSPLSRGAVGWVDARGRRDFTRFDPVIALRTPSHDERDRAMPRRDARSAVSAP